MPQNVDVLRNLGEYIATETMASREISIAKAILTLMESPGIDARHRRQLIDIALWKFTEASGMSPHPKYNLRYVSDGARNLEVASSLNHECKRMIFTCSVGYERVQRYESGQSSASLCSNNPPKTSGAAPAPSVGHRIRL